MNSRPSGSDQNSSSFFLLDERIQRWIWESRWSALRDVQEQSIPVILTADQDVILAASTASGKTEAAFMPILTRLLQDESTGCVIYVSPLKALINDQWKRLEQLCERLEIRVHPWHGDISASRKKQFLKKPSGIVLITPESLEAMLMNHGLALGGLLRELRYVVIDEMHAFIGSERGMQLQSQMNRIEQLVRRRVPRIALSATIGDMQLAAEYLRPGHGASVTQVNSKESGTTLQVLVKAVVNDPLARNPTPEIDDSEGSDEDEEANSDTGADIVVAEDCFKLLRGANHLIFPNSRAKVEFYADRLRKKCEDLGVPNEFWPHHGSLAKDIRAETETALKAGDRPATAICTTTLELGIDIGAVKSVAQIGPAPSVSSLRQRLGRSGRRKGEPAILRAWCIEPRLRQDSPLDDQLRHGLVQTVAQILLLIEGWYEPPRMGAMHLSTLVQQILAAIAQYGGLTTSQAWVLLCERGPFNNLNQSDFLELLRELGDREILIQDNEGLLLHGPLGERLIGHYSFYAAFQSEEEYRLVTYGKTLGSLPVTGPVAEGSYLIFAGRRWKVLNVRVEDKVIEVVRARGGRPPTFSGTGAWVSDRVRQTMRAVLGSSEQYSFLNRTATTCLEEARRNYHSLGLAGNYVLNCGATQYLFPWMGDWVKYTLQLALQTRGLEVLDDGLCLAVGVTNETLIDVLVDFKDGAFPTANELAEAVSNKHSEKWDWTLPNSLLNKNYASSFIDINAALRWLRDAHLA